MQVIIKSKVFNSRTDFQKLYCEKILPVHFNDGECNCWKQNFVLELSEERLSSTKEDDFCMYISLNAQINTD